MKFYIAFDDREATLDCFTTLREAKEAVRASESRGHVSCVNVDVNAESVRRLLSGQGGYAKDYKVVWEAK